MRESNVSQEKSCILVFPAKKCSALKMAEGGSRNVKEKLAKLKTEEQVVLKSCKASLNAIKLCDQQLASDVAIVAGELENTRLVILRLLKILNNF